MTGMLNYADVRQKASSSRSYRVKVPSSNGTKFSLGQTINIDLPSNMRNSYIDFANSYLSFKVTCAKTPNDAADIVATLGSGGAGAYSLFRRLEGVVGSQTLFSVENYSQLVDILMDMEVNHNYKNGVGAVLMGTNSNKSKGRPVGRAAASATAAPTSQFCLPLIGNCLFNTEKYIPAFSSEQIRLRLVLDDIANAVISVAGAGGVSANSDIELTEVEMVVYMVEVDENIQQMIQEQNGGVFSLVGDDYRHAQGSLAADANNGSVVTGFSFGSLNRILGAFTPTACRTLATCAFSRSTADVTSIAFSVNGQKLPAREVKELGASMAQGTTGGGGGAESLAEALVADRQLSNFNHQSSLATTATAAGGAATAVDNISDFLVGNTPANVDGTVDDIGTYFFAIDTERVRGDLSKMYAGINTIGAVTQLETTHDTAPEACNIDVFANYTTKLTLDVNGANVYEVQI